MIKVKDLSFSFRQSGAEQKILRDINFEIKSGDFVALIGPSGSGKSTLFHILGGLLKPSSGKLFVAGKDVYALSDEELSLFRNRDLGFVFQQFFLLPRTSVLENILLPARLRGDVESLHFERAEALAIRVGLKEQLRKKPNELSGGQQQRVAIARALFFEPRFLLADEATGNLDSRNAAEIFDLFAQLNSEGSTLLWVTHDRELAAKIPQRIVLRDGEIEAIEKNSPEAQVLLAKDFNIPSHRLPDSPPRSRWKLGPSLPLAFANLTRNKSQSFLTMLGVIFGVSAVLSMMTLGTYAKRRILEGYQGLGANKLVLSGYGEHRSKRLDLNKVRFQQFNMENDIMPLKRIFPEIRLISPQLRAWDATATFGGVTSSDKIRLLGVNEEYVAINNLDLREGIALYPYHVNSGSPVCLVGGEISDRLFSRRRPLGEVINVTINERSTFPCRIVGILSSLNSNTGGDKPNTDILIPYTYFQRLTSGWNREIHTVTMQVAEGQDPALIEKKLKGFFANKYGSSGDFFVGKDAKLLAQMKKFLNIFTYLLFGISILALVVGGMGINNMMLISISERFREIGLRKALGASQSFIRNQILTESILLASTAGLLGLLLGFGLYQSLIYAATRFIPNLQFEWIIEYSALSISLFSIVLVGILSGLVPALKASKLEVIEALRSE